MTVPKGPNHWRLHNQNQNAMDFDILSKGIRSISYLAGNFQDYWAMVQSIHPEIAPPMHKMPKRQVPVRIMHPDDFWNAIGKIKDIGVFIGAEWLRSARKPRGPMQDVADLSVKTGPATNSRGELFSTLDSISIELMDLDNRIRPLINGTPLGDRELKKLIKDADRCYKELGEVLNGWDQVRFRFGMDPYNSTEQGVARLKEALGPYQDTQPHNVRVMRDSSHELERIIFGEQAHPTYFPEAMKQFNEMVAAIEDAQKVYAEFAILGADTLRSLQREALETQRAVQEVTGPILPKSDDMVIEVVSPSPDQTANTESDVEPSNVTRAYDTHGDAVHTERRPRVKRFGDRDPMAEHLRGAQERLERGELPKVTPASAEDVAAAQQRLRQTAEFLRGVDHHGNVVRPSTDTATAPAEESKRIDLTTRGFPNLMDNFDPNKRRSGSTPPSTSHANRAPGRGRPEERLKRPTDTGRDDIERS